MAKQSGSTISERYMDADNFFNLRDGKERSKRIRDYIDGRIDYKLDERFRLLFAAKEKAAEVDRRCLVCGTPFEREGKSPAKYCAIHRIQSTRRMVCDAAWTFLIERYYPLAEKIMEIMKEEGRWP